MMGGFGLGLRGTAAVNLGFIGAWIAVAARLRGEYVRTIQSSIHRHRIDSEQVAGRLARPQRGGHPGREARVARSPRTSAMRSTCSKAQGLLGLERHLRALLAHEDADIRRRALAMLSAARDTSISRAATDLLRDPDLGVRTEALLYVTREMRVDPIRQLEELGEFEDFSIRAGMAAFLASPGRRRISMRRGCCSSAMAHSDGEGGRARPAPGGPRLVSRARLVHRSAGAPDLRPGPGGGQASRSPRPPSSCATRWCRRCSARWPGPS